MPESQHFKVSIEAATDEQRRELERQLSAPLGSDACVLVRFGEHVVGWGDDYGTFRALPARPLDDALEQLGAALIEAAVNLWVVG